MPSVTSPVRERYTAKFVVGLLFVFVVIATVGGFTYLQTTSTVEADVQERSETTAELEAATVSQWVSGVEIRLLELLNQFTVANGRVDEGASQEQDEAIEEWFSPGDETVDAEPVEDDAEDVSDEN